MASEFDCATEALILLIALIPFLGMDAFLHRRTQVSTAALGDQLASKASVVRDGHRVLVDAVDLVPGDLVEVSTGEPFPADGLILEATSAQMDESALTGEAYPVRKAATELVSGGIGDLAPEDRHWGFAGTRLLAGRVLLRVIFTGAGTLYGEIVQTVLEGKQERTPLQKAVDRLVKNLLIIALAFCVLLAMVRLYQGHGWIDAIISAVTLAVAALPEEFPVVLTLFLGMGVYRLARCQALVRRATVVENIGRVTTICSDKTGTLTEGRLRLAHQLPAEGTAMGRLLEIAATASRRDSGDPLDSAILERVSEREPQDLVAVFPFTEDRKRETTIVRQGQGQLVAVKGAPEAVLAICDLTPPARAAWMERVGELAGEGHKVIACAGRNWFEAGSGEPDRGFQLAGLLAFEDTAREGVRDALRQCREAGIRVIMVTGDHPETARSIASEIGLGGGMPVVVTGDQLDARIAGVGLDAIKGIDVVARAVPVQKLALVRGLQAGGELVAVTGDGVNDVPALQAADIGIAMGGRGTRAAREVASIVLVDDNFRTIVRAIAEGSQLFTSLQQSFQYLLMIHIPLVITAALIPLLGYPILYLPIHIVWLELIIHPTALLAFQNPANASMGPLHITPRRVRFFSRSRVEVILVTGLLITALVYAGYVHGLGSGWDVAHARAVALAILILAGAGISALLSRFRGTPAVLVSTVSALSAVVLIQVPWLSELLNLHPLPLGDWFLVSIGAGLVCLPLLYQHRNED